MDWKKIGIYAGIIASIITALSGMYFWGKTNAGTEVHYIQVHDTTYVIAKVPEAIEKIVEKPVYIYRIDTVYKKEIIERTLEVVKLDTVYIEQNPRRYFANYNNDDWLNDKPTRQNYPVPIIHLPEIDNQKREWWEDVLYIGATAAATWGVTRIK